MIINIIFGFYELETLWSDTLPDFNPDRDQYFLLNRLWVNTIYGQSVIYLRMIVKLYRG